MGQQREDRAGIDTGPTYQTLLATMNANLRDMRIDHSRVSAFVPPMPAIVFSEAYRVVADVTRRNEATLAGVHMKCNVNVSNVQRQKVDRTRSKRTAAQRLEGCPTASRG